MAIYFFISLTTISAASMFLTDGGKPFKENRINWKIEQENRINLKLRPWSAGSWSSCNSTCSSRIGVQARIVSCDRPGLCAEKKPEEYRTCFSGQVCYICEKLNVSKMCRTTQNRPYASRCDFMINILSNFYAKKLALFLHANVMMFFLPK
jgi:hypothetical protein